MNRYKQSNQTKCDREENIICIQSLDIFKIIPGYNIYNKHPKLLLSPEYLSEFSCIYFISVLLEIILLQALSETLGLKMLHLAKMLSLNLKGTDMKLCALYPVLHFQNTTMSRIFRSC